MKATKTICLAAILCVFCAAYVALLTRPAPMLASIARCNASYPSCFVPVPAIGRLMP